MFNDGIPALHHRNYVDAVETTDYDASDKGQRIACRHVPGVAGRGDYQNLHFLPMATML